jgi:hypothetical protein
VRIGVLKERLKAAYAVGSGAIIVALLTGWISGSYSITAHRERYLELRELQIENEELSRAVSEKGHRLATMKRGDIPIDFRCTLSRPGYPKGLALFVLAPIPMDIVPRSGLVPAKVWPHRP